ncbi:helix-turn-helix domain-containing protein [Stutzerimonas tarimensis]|uniref:Helix-turn-helix domain-containing protein n=1 Tax=Stutzerimonas tarimensis TaxID=1507735 RepID=A0ABV7T0W6_9GAMM
MQRLQAFKYELMPTGEQQMRRFAGSCRFVFNGAVRGGADSPWWWR